MDYSATSLIEADIQGACSSLGSWTSKGYTKDPDCIESLKDILRYLKRDSGSHEVRRLLGRIQVLDTDLLPLLKFYHDDSLLFELLLRLLVNLTNPAILLYKEELPQEKSARNDYMEIVAHLQSYKKAFTDSKVWEAIVKKLESLLYMSPQERGDEENDTIERMLVMVRNVVHVPANPTEEKRTDDDVSVHDQVLWAMHLAKMEDLLLYICTSDVDQDYCFHALEILSLMLREQSPQVLASAGQGRSNTEKMEDELELLKMREMELSQKKKQMQARMGRHPRFGGTFTVQNMQAIGDNKLIAHSPLNKLCEIDFDQTKSFHAKPKNKRPTEDGKIMRRSTLNIRLFLKSLCEDFLKLAYNPMMKTVKRHLQRNKAQSNDESYYFWSVQFFMEFCRQSHSDISLVSETLSKETFHYIQTQMEQYYEMMVTEKRKIRLWAKRLHVALKAYRELVKSLAAMDSSQDERVKEASRVLKGTIFYMPEYREVVLYLLLNFNDCVQPISYLRDLAETVHVYLKMLEQFAKQTRHVIVQEKKKSKKKAKPKKSQRPAIQREEDEQLLWLEVAPDLSKTIQRKEELPSDIVVFDPTLGTSEEEHMLDATRRIERALKSKKPAEALAILRSARQLWPEKQAFGSDDISPDDEFMMLREMFFAKLDTSEERDKDQNNEEEDEEEDESEGEGETAAEKEFSFLAFIKRFANPKVIIAYSKLLSNFRENSPTVNHCTARMFHRLAWDLKLEPMMFQASVFRVFQEVMADYSRLSKSSADTELKDLNRLATYVVRCFVEHASKNNLAMMELLFWKNSKDAYELQFGYGSSATKKTSKVSWTEEEELELKALYDRFNEQATPEKDVVDYIMENIIDQKKTRRAIILHLKNLGLVDKNKAFKKKVSVQRQWKEDEVNELQELFEKYKESTDIMGMITEHMSVKRPRHRIVDKLLELGLVSDKKELRKKRSRKNDFDNWRGHGGSVSEIDTSSSDDDDQDRVYAVGTEEGAPRVRSSGSGETFRTTPRVEVATTSEELKEILTRLVAAGNASWLEWLVQSLEDAVEDWDDGDGPTSVPLVPFLEHHHFALQDSDFCSLLKTIGIDPPANEQEAYWRIPASMTTTMINSRIQVLRKAQEGDYSTPIVVMSAPTDDALDKELHATTSHEVQRNTKKKVEHLEALRQALSKKQTGESSPNSSGRGSRRRRQRVPEPDDEDGAQTSDEEVDVASLDADDTASQSQRSPSGKKRKRPILFDENDDEETPAAQKSPDDSEDDVLLSSASAGNKRLEQNERKTDAIASGKPSKKRLVVFDDSDDDEALCSISNSVQRNDGKGPIWIDSDTTASLDPAAAAGERTTKRSLVIEDSDEESEVVKISNGTSQNQEEAVDMKPKRHKATVISSDEEE